MYFSALRSHLNEKGADPASFQPPRSGENKPLDPQGLDPTVGVTLELCAGIVDKSKVS